MNNQAKTLELTSSDIAQPNDEQLSQELAPAKSLQEEYQEALLKSGIQAANLLAELIDLKIMPDPRAKEMADVALEVVKLISTTPHDRLDPMKKG